MIALDAMATTAVKLLGDSTRSHMLVLELELLAIHFASGVTKAGPGPLSPRRERQFAGVRTVLGRLRDAVVAGREPMTGDVEFLAELAEHGWAARGIAGQVAATAQRAAA